MLGFLNSVESSLSEGAGENPVEGAKLGGAGLDGFSMNWKIKQIYWELKSTQIGQIDVLKSKNVAEVGCYTCTSTTSTCSSY